MTKDRHLGRRFTDRQTAEGLFDQADDERVPKMSLDLDDDHAQAQDQAVQWAPGGSNPEPAD
jgi:hypothetical protein